MKRDPDSPTVAAQLECLCGMEISAILVGRAGMRPLEEKELIRCTGGYQ